jgi:2',3'-cyclic-nucleotide 2'-phosphodiesterase (5'-nucleotidase family)
MKKNLCILLLTVGALIGCSTGQHVARQQHQKSIVVLYENDVHGQIDGYPKLAGLRDAISQSDTAWTAVVSCGDYLSGGVACSLKKGEYIVTLMNSVGYDAVTLGNHEYDFGMPRLMELLPGLNTSAVCVNLYDYQGTEPLMAPYVIRQYGNQRVAFVGVSTPESMDAEAYSFFDDKGRQLYDLHTKETYQMVQQAADKARKEGADYVIVLAHLGELESETGVDSY